MLVGRDEGQLVGRIAEHFLARRNALRAAVSRRSVIVSASTNADATAVSGAIRERLRGRRELETDEVVRLAIDNRRTTFNVPIATGDRLRLFRETRGTGRLDEHISAAMAT